MLELGELGLGLIVGELEAVEILDGCLQHLDERQESLLVGSIVHVLLVDLKTEDLVVLDEV